MPLFNPNANASTAQNEQVIAYQQALDAAAQQRKIADMLRKQGDSPAEGRMIGKHYVAPTNLQHLSQLLGSVGGAYMGYKADEADKFAKGQVQQAQSSWADKVSQTPTEEVRTPYMTPGIDGDEQIPGTYSTTQRQLPRTLGQAFKLQTEGAMIPGNEKNAELYGKYAQAEIAREDQQKEKASAAELKAIADHEGLVEKGRQKMDQIRLTGTQNLTPAQRMQLKIMEDTTKREIAANQAAATLKGIEARARAAGQKSTPVAPRVINDLSESQGVAEGLSNAVSTYSPAYGGVEGAVDRLSGRWNPWASKASHDAANWWGDYENQVALVERHAKFGSTLNPGEKAAWQKATITEGMDPRTIQHNIETRAKVAASFYNKLRKSYIDGGHKQVEEAFPVFGDGMEPTFAPQAQVPQAAPRPLQRTLGPQTAPPQAVPASGLPPGVIRRKVEN
jgi:hypothetical protein